ncbi:hypothetical protein [Chitinophaga filiformis]|uniref:CHAT domain-containing protein n=1 Tax=Chitinophaga filiformis TaxID=104663 RepID=A0A1G7YY01_CHIFI|nr:hypothetical protein [Chitinophaga filiformis]SDH01149.1 hypothetical protein SAMN04488121_10843 [Chitinophaga filiformis]
MTSQDQLLAIKQKIQFKFSRVPGESDKIKLQIIYLNNQTKPIYMYKSDILNKRTKLSDHLAQFIKTRQKRDLFDLAYIGYDIFKKIDDALKSQDARFYNVTWKKDILNNINDTTKSLTKVQKSNKILEAVFPADFSFFVGLLFPREPDKQEWTDYSTNELLQLFFDFRFKIINNIDPSEYEGGIYLADAPLKKGGTLKVIHATDSEMYTSPLEKKSLNHDPDIVIHVVDKRSDLIEFWKNKEHPRLILFSTHYSESDSERFSFKLTHDDFTNHHLIRIGEIPDDQKALLFLNCCKTANVPFSGFSNVLTDLYPNYSLGFITTGFDLRGPDADAFPDTFHRIFMQENMMILDAFVKTKNYLVFQSTTPLYAAFGYMLWQVVPHLTYVKKSLRGGNRNVK